MTTYVIASKATQPFLPECQMLGEFLEANCPDVTVKVVIKSNEDWGEYIDSVSIQKTSNFSFVSRFAAPTVFTTDSAPLSTLWRVSRSVTALISSNMSGTITAVPT